MNRTSRPEIFPLAEKTDVRPLQASVYCFPRKDPPLSRFAAWRSCLRALSMIAVLGWLGTASPASGEYPLAAKGVEQFITGLNLPWVKYGLDFGESAFGHFGLSSDCSQGFRPERFPQSDGVISCERSQEQVLSGSYSLELQVDIAGNDPDLPPNGEVVTDLQDIAHVPRDYSVDLDGETVTAWVFVSAGHEGESPRSNFLQVFVKDASPGVIGLYGEKVNIPTAGGWLEVGLEVGPDTADFDPTRIRLIGVKVGIGEGSSAEIVDSIYIDRIESSHPDIAFDFEGPSRAAIDAGRLTGAGVRTLRWFVFADGRASPEFDEGNFVVGLDDEFLRDFGELLELAGEYGFKVVPVLFDFLLCGEPEELNGVQLFGRTDLITDPERRQSFLANALGPLLDRYGGAPEILAWEVMNEPEWCLSDLIFPSGITRPSELPPDGAATVNEMRGFVGRIAEFIHDHPATEDPWVTLGSASESFLDPWSDTGLDLCQFHLYNCDGCLDEGLPLPPMHECLLGEFAARETLTDRSVFWYLEDTCAGGYAGAMPWSWRGRDSVSPIGLEEQQVLLDDFAEFLATSTCPRLSPDPCDSDPTLLCLNSERFVVEVEWRDFQGGTGGGQLVPFRSDDSGLFWFFDPDNWEMLVKVLDGCGINDRFWVFAAATTNVEYTLRVTDRLTGSSKSYFNPLGRSAPAITDTDAFATCGGSSLTAGPSARLEVLGMRDEPRRRNLEPGAPKQADDCPPGPADMCLNNGRFRVAVDWRAFVGGTGSGRVVRFGSDDSGLFWFFDPDNWEMLVKVLDGCDINNRYWVFSAATTNVGYTLRVTDTETDTVQKYDNRLGRAAAAITDTDAFATCPPPPPEPSVVIDSPIGGEVGLTVTFRWHILNPEPGEVYRYQVRLDKGSNACDNSIEQAFDAGTETCLRVDLSPRFFSNARPDLAILATNSKGEVLCQRGERFEVDPSLSPSPPCP